jgi:hypothetical protein
VRATNRKQLEIFPDNPDLFKLLFITSNTLKNKEDSKLDRLQKDSGEYYYVAKGS